MRLELEADVRGSDVGYRQSLQFDAIQRAETEVVAEKLCPLCCSFKASAEGLRSMCACARGRRQCALVSSGNCHIN